MNILLRAGANDLDKLVLSASADVVMLQAADGESEKRPTFTINAYNGGLLDVPMFFRPVVIDLSGLHAGRVTILKDHDPSQIVGQGIATISKSSVDVVGQITGDHTEKGEPANLVVTHSKNGFVWGASVGVQVERMENIEENGKVKVNGRTFNGPIGVVRAGRLGEVSFVGVGADETASAKIAATAAEQLNKEHTMNKFKKWLTARGMDFDALDEAKRFELHAEFVADSADADPPADDKPVDADPPADDPPADDKPADDTDTVEASMKAIRKTTADEVRRVEAIGTLCAGSTHAELKAKAIEEGWSKDQTELAVMKASRPTPPAIHTGSGADISGSVLQAAVMMGAPSMDVSKHFDEPTLEAASKQFGRGLGIGEMVLMLAEQNTGRRYSMRRDGVNTILKAAFSTIGLSGILSNLANKFLLAGYTYGDNSDLAIASTRSVSDFKQISSYRLTGNTQFQEVAPDGEIKHATLSEDTYNNQARTYGIMLSITRQQLINDDLGAFDDMQKIIGQGAAHKRRSVVWTAFMDNAAFFASGNSNYMSGATTVLSIDSLSAAELLLLDQKDDNGQPISVMPKLLVVPTALSASATAIFKSMELRNTTGSTKYPIANIHAGKYQPVVSTYLGNSNFTGYSATAWYLLADPNELPTIEVCYLNGVQQPTIESADADFNTLGIQFRGYFDFGVAKQDPKGGVKSKGSV